jgi:hypothetical protein
MTAHLLAADAALEFIRAGNARLTLVSRATQARFTYRVRRAKRAKRPMWFVDVLSGPSNTDDYQPVGAIDVAALHPYRGSSPKVQPAAPSVKAFAWTYGRLASGKPIDGVEVWHEGRCGRCGRVLTVPESIERGLGPECAGRE